MCLMDYLEVIMSYYGLFLRYALFTLTADRENLGLRSAAAIHFLPACLPACPSFAQVSTMSLRASDVLLILVAIIFPPAAAAFVTGCSCDLLINICLTILGYLPGHIHAFWLIYRRMKAEEIYGRGQYVYIGNGTYQPIPHAQPFIAQAPYQRGYGATAAGP
ncbi:hypothetical protein F5148DRAFT_1169538 [Russula earlei]|uniref:Uncharacterized protein n=1 Tax=Russula earlei TaxID=71964 RepID=A0ACC0UK25_9AGAM|nr:hypothetical protein F5148DRAFT_1169538 [Russula earlei]